MEDTPCPVCMAADNTPIFQVKDLAFRSPGQFSFVRCAQCGVLYQNPRPGKEEIQQYYPPDYEPFHRGGNQRFAWLNQVRMRPRCSQIARLASGGRLLDVGCANGVFLHEMRRYGTWDVHGVEPNPEAAAYAHKRLGVPIMPDLDQANYPKRYFDVVTMWDVIEHVHDPVAMLTNIAGLLKPEGWLLISTPDAESLDARIFGRYWKGLDPPRHLVVYTREALERLLARSGLHPVRTFYFYGRYTAFALSLQLFIRDRYPLLNQYPLVDRILFFPLWRWLSFPLFRLVELLGCGPIMTFQARCQSNDHAPSVQNRQYL